MERLIMAVALAAALLAGCGGASAGSPTATPDVRPTEVPTPDPALSTALSDQVDAAERAWRDSDIASYRMTILEVHSVWSAQRLTITVTDGHVTDFKNICIPAPAQAGTCTVQPVEPSLYAVPELLGMARDLIAQRNPSHISISLDPSLGYPLTLGYNDPQIYDEDYGLKIESFERLPGRPASALGATLRLRVGESTQAEGLTIMVDQVAEDSRCPHNVACAWSGQVVVELLVTAPGAAQERVRVSLLGLGMQLEEPAQIAGGGRIQLISVTPYPVYSPSGSGAIPARNYAITLQVQR